MRRKSMGIVLTAVGMLMLTGMSVFAGETEAPAGADTVKFALSGEKLAPYAQDAIDRYEEKTGNKVEVTLIPNNQDMYSKISLLMSAADTCPDVIAEDGFMINSDAAAGKLEPLDEWLKDWEDMKNFNPEVLEGGRGVDGKLYGVMTSTDTQIIYYNRNLLKDIGMEGDWNPKDWNELIDVAKKLKEANADKEDFIPMWIFASSTFPEETSMRTFQLLLSGTGEEGTWPGQLYDAESGKWVVDKENLSKVFNFVNDVFNVSQVAEDQADAADSTAPAIITSDYMQNGKIGLVFTGSWVMGTFKENAQFPWTAEGTAMDTWGMTTCPTSDGQAPGYTTVSGGWTWAVPADAGNKEGGVEFLKELCSYDGIKGRVLYTGEISPRTDVNEDPEYINQTPSSVTFANDQLQYTHFRPSVDGYSSVTTVYTEAVESVALGEATPEEAIENMKAALVRIVGEDKVLEK